MSSAIFENNAVRLKQGRHGPMLYWVNDQYVGRSIDTYGEFSEGETELFRQLVRPGMTVIDVGSNIGAHTLWMAKTVGPQGQVLAFEPQRAVFQLLSGTLALNDCYNVRAYHAGLGSEAGTVVIPPINYAAGGNFGGLSLGMYKEGEEVPVFTLDSFNLAQCHFVKIDVEGMEREVLVGGEKTLERTNALLYVENDREPKSAELIKWFLDREYRLYWHLPPLFRADNFFGATENIFGNVVSINMVCIPKNHPLKVEGLRPITSPDANWRG